MGRNTLASLAPSGSSEHAEVSACASQLVARARNYFRMIHNVARSADEPEFYPVNLAEVVEGISLHAPVLDVALHVVSLPQRLVRGTMFKVHTILHNLVSNTRTHVVKKPKQAWLTFTVEANHCRMEYWDNSGSAPDAFDQASFLEGKPDHQGIRDIARSANELGWVVEVTTHPTEQSYHYTFAFELLPEAA